MLTCEILVFPSDKDKKMRSFESQVISGDVEKLTEVVEAQCRGEMFLRSLRSRYGMGHSSATLLIKNRRLKTP